MIKKFLALISAIYFLFAGTGYNVVSYCCESCREEGVEHIILNECTEEQTSCCESETGHSEQMFKELSLAHHNIHQTHTCALKRFVLDNFHTVDDKLNTDANFLSSILFDIQPVLNGDKRTFNYKNTSQNNCINYSEFISGRDLLTLKQVFLI